MSDLLEGLVEAPAAVTDGVALEFQIKRVLLDRLLAITVGCSSTKDVQPVLGNFCFSALGNQLTVSTSNAMISAVVRVPVTEAQKGGMAVFPVATLQSVVREASEELIHLRVSAKKNQYTGFVKSGTAKWQIPLMQPDAFPQFSLPSEFSVEVGRLDLFESLRKVHRAVSQDSMKPYLMLVDIKNGKMRASDGIRFQQTKTTFPFDCQIPAQAVPELLKRLAASKQEFIGVAETERALLFKFGFVVIVVQKVMAKFPDVDEVLLKPALGNDQSLIVGRSALESAIRKVRFVADEETSAVVLSLNHGSVTVEAKDRRGAVATEEVPAEWALAPRHVSFNHKHLSDLLASFSAETCWLKFGKDLKSRPSPLLLEDKDFLAVLSQIRTDWL